MGVLDTFFILFKTDADKATTDVKELDRATDTLGRDLLKTDAAAAGLSRSFMGMAQSLAAPLLALASVGGAFAIVMERVQQIDEIGDMAGKLRSSAQDYDAFTRAVQATGGSLADAQANLAGFGDKLADAAARPDGPNAKNFAKWGIAFKDVKGEAVGAVDGILALAKSLEGVSQAEAIGRLRRLGIQDADTIAFLLQGKQAIIDKMEAEKRAGVVTDEQIQIVGEYQSALGATKNSLDTFANRLTGALLPALTKGLELFNRFFGWMLDHQTLVEGFFIGVAGVITAVYLPAIASAAAATIAATWPFLAIAAAVIGFGAAVALAYEDVTAFMNGQQSLIGELVKKYQWLIDAVKDAWGKIVASISSAWSTIQPILQAIADGGKTILNSWLELYTPLYNAFVNLFGAVGDLVGAFKDRIAADIAAVLPSWIANFESMKTEVGQAFADMLTQIQPFVDGVKVAADVIKLTFETLGEILKAIWGSTIGWMADKVNGIAEAIRGLGAGVRIPVTIDTANGPQTPGAAMGSLFNPGARASALGAQTPASLGAANTNVKTNTVNVGDVNVDARGGDAKAIAAGVRSALQGELRNTASQFDDGVDR